MDNLEKVTRLEVIDHTKCEACHGVGRMKVEGQEGDFECPACHGLGMGGRTVILRDQTKQLEAQLQDDGQTLKIFVTKRES